MTLHIEWMRFKKICLAGQGREAIRNAKRIFYAGAVAYDYLAVKTHANPRRVASLLNELKVFRNASAKVAKAVRK